MLGPLQSQLHYGCVDKTFVIIMGQPHLR